MNVITIVLICISIFTLIVWSIVKTIAWLKDNKEKNSLPKICDKYCCFIGCLPKNPFDEDKRIKYIVDILDVKKSTVTGEYWVKFRYKEGERKYGRHNNIFIYTEDGDKIPQTIFEEPISTFLEDFEKIS